MKADFQSTYQQMKQGTNFLFTSKTNQTFRMNPEADLLKKTVVDKNVVAVVDLR